MQNDRPPQLLRTADEVVAENLRRLRDERDLTRPQLAEELTTISGREWNRWKIVDLEGARSPKQTPRPATWADLVALALVLSVSVFELVLPVDAETPVVTAIARDDVELDPFPDDESVPDNLRGRPKTLGRAYARKSDRDELGRLLFGLPGEWLTPENLETLAARKGYDMTDARADIANVQEGLARAVELIESMKQNEQENT